MQNEFQSGLKADRSLPGFRLALALLLLVSPVVRSAENDVSSQTFPIGAEGVVTVRATSGVIRVGVWDRDEVRVDMIKRADNRELADLMRVEFESEYNTLSIVTEIIRGTGPLGETIDAGIIDLGLTIPRRASLDLTATTANVRIEAVRGSTRANTTTGSISTVDLAGSVTLESTHGPLQASFASIHEDQRIDLTSEHGSLRLMLPQSVAAFIKAGSARGPVRCELPLTVDEGPDGGHRVEGALNTGGAHINCETQGGGILILKRM